MNNLNLFLDYIRRIWLYIFKPYIAKRKLKRLPANEKKRLYHLLKKDTQSFEGSSFDSIARSLEDKSGIDSFHKIKQGTIT